MYQRSLMFRLIVCCAALCTTAAAVSSEVEYRSGKGWVSFGWLPESPDYAFIRDYLEQSEDYQLSQDPSNSPWHMDNLRVGYHDLNDDGMQEMFLWFNVATWYCGTIGCQMQIFQKRDGKWQIIGGDSGTGFWVSDEKIMGYRTMYGLTGGLMRWQGKQYRTTCIEILPAEMRGARDIRCENG